MPLEDAPTPPPPKPDPEVEPGEDEHTHLLPNLERLRAMKPEDRQTLKQLVSDWDGPLVVEFRQRVDELEEAE